jgi:hypothetical protein
MVAISSGWLMFIIGQAVLVVGAVVASHMRTKVAIAELGTLLEVKFSGVDGRFDNVSGEINTLKSDHKSLREKVDGISRHVALIEGMEMEKKRNPPMCPLSRGGSDEDGP